MAVLGVRVTIDNLAHRLVDGGSDAGCSEPTLLVPAQLAGVVPEVADEVFHLGDLASLRRDDAVAGFLTRGSEMRARSLARLAIQ